VCMSEPAGQFGQDVSGREAPADAGPAAGPVAALTYPHCSRCHADLTHCVFSARFCPRCGHTLSALGEASPFPPAPPALPLRALTLEPRESIDTHALILGYANAMFRLGWRYENGHGTCRNAHEAVRCYFKAAKLGNTSARARLTSQGAPDADTAPPAETADHAPPA
jgi:TPR repeat protein